MYGESDIVVHGLNSLGARMNFFARAAKKSRKRFAGGVLQPTHYIEVTYKMRPSADADPMHSLLEANIVHDFAKLRLNYDRLNLALYFLGVVHKLGQQGVVDSPDLFNLLGNALRAAETSPKLDHLKLHFELKILSSQGVLPSDVDFTTWITTSLAEHAQIEIPESLHRQLLLQTHGHLLQYLG